MTAARNCTPPWRRCSARRRRRGSSRRWPDGPRRRQGQGLVQAAEAALEWLHAKAPGRRIDDEVAGGRVSLLDATWSARKFVVEAECRSRPRSTSMWSGAIF